MTSGASLALGQGRPDLSIFQIFCCSLNPCFLFPPILSCLLSTQSIFHPNPRRLPASLYHPSAFRCPTATSLSCAPWI